MLYNRGELSDGKAGTARYIRDLDNLLVNQATSQLRKETSYIRDLGGTRLVGQESVEVRARRHFRRTRSAKQAGEVAMARETWRLGLGQGHFELAGDRWRLGQEGTFGLGALSKLAR